jgi:biopolymer transport protein TolR
MSFGRLERQTGPQPMSDINMTPLVDVMLVLVVIFIMTAPLLASSIRLTLPQAEGAKPVDSPSVVLVVVDPAGQTFLNDRPIEPAVLRQVLATTAAQHPETELQLRADAAVPYGRVVEVMGLAQAAGLSRIGFVTDPKGIPGAPK